MPDMGNIRIKDENMNKTTIITNVQTHLFELQDLKYRDFHAKLMPTVNKEKIIFFFENNGLSYETLMMIEKEMPMKIRKAFRRTGIYDELTYRQR